MKNNNTGITAKKDKWIGNYSFRPCSYLYAVFFHPNKLNCGVILYYKHDNEWIYVEVQLKLF